MFRHECEGDHEGADRVPGPAVKRDDPASQEGQAGHRVNEVVLRDAMVDADPFRAQYPADPGHGKREQPPPSPGHRRVPTSTALSVCAERSLLEMKPRAPLRPMRLP
jgi:hypothetical protein